MLSGVNFYGWFQDLFNPGATDAAAKAATGGSALEAQKQKTQKTLLIAAGVALGVVAVVYLVKSK